MQLALLGSDTETLLLAQAAKQCGHSVAWAGDASAAAQQELLGISPNIALSDDWQDVLQLQHIDAVLVAASDNDDALAERLRVIAQVGTALMLSHPASESPLFYHELDMIRQDTGVCIVPLVADRWHPYIVELSEQIRGGSKIEQVTFERTLLNRSKPHVMRQFMRDVCVLRAVCGELDRVSALPAADAAATFANLGVQMSGDANYPIRWSVGPAMDNIVGRLTISTAPEPVRIEISEDPSTWRVSGRSDLVNVTAVDPLAPYAVALDMLEKAAAKKPAGCDWSEACRSVELADGVEQSLRRGRAIQLHDETYTEAGVFKGLMGMAGCGLILLGVVVAVLGTTVGALLKRVGFDGAARMVGRWPYALLAVFVVFLLLQLLKMVVPTADSRDIET